MATWNSNEPNGPMYKINWIQMKQKPDDHYSANACGLSAKLISLSNVNGGVSLINGSDLTLHLQFVS